MENTNNFSAKIHKIDSDFNFTCDDAFLSLYDATREEAMAFLNDDKNHPCIDCAGFKIELYNSNEDVIYFAEYIYGQGWITEVTA